MKSWTSASWNSGKDAHHCDLFLAADVNESDYSQPPFAVNLMLAAKTVESDSHLQAHWAAVAEPEFCHHLTMDLLETSTTMRDRRVPLHSSNVVARDPCLQASDRKPDLAPPISAQPEFRGSPCSCTSWLPTSRSEHPAGADPAECRRAMSERLILQLQRFPKGKSWVPCAIPHSCTARASSTCLSDLSPCRHRRSTALRSFVQRNLCGCTRVCALFRRAVASTDLRPAPRDAFAARSRDARLESHLRQSALYRSVVPLRSLWFRDSRRSHTA